MFAFRCDPARTRELAAYFQVLSLANNHSMDFGWPALEDTIDGLRSFGTLTVGAGRTLEHAVKARFVDVESTRIGFLGVSTLLPVGIRASADRPGVAGIRVRTSYEIHPEAFQEEPGMPPTIRTHVVAEDQAWLEKLVWQAAGECDALMVISHMGYGVDHRLLEFESPFAESILRAGAACVVGDHVHTIRGATCGPSGLVIYGLNNFIKQFAAFEPSAEQRMLIEAQRAVAGADPSLGLIASIELAGGRCVRGEFSPISYDSWGLPERPPPEDTRRALDSFMDQCAALGWSPEWEHCGDVVRWSA